jgi:predicted RND superfamily exporter protein
LFIGVVTLTPLLFIYLFTLQEIKELNADKNKFLEVLREKENKLEMRKVEYQKLTSEDVVVGKAKDKFDLVRIEYLDKIQVNNNKISNLKKYISKKYE